MGTQIITPIDTAIERVRRRHALLAAFDVLQSFLAGGIGFLILWITLAKLMGIPAPTVGLGAWLLAVILAASGIMGWLKRPSTAKAAWLLDNALESQNLFGTLLDLPKDESPVRQHLEAQAESATAALHTPTAFPALCNRTGRWLWLPTTLLIASLFLPAKDPFGWRDQRLRQQSRDRAVAAAENAIDTKLAADATISAETRAFLEQAKKDLAASQGEQEVAATLAQMAEAAANSNNKEMKNAADKVLQDAAQAAGSESAVAAAAAVASSQDQSDNSNANTSNDPSNKPPSENAANKTAGTENNATDTNSNSDASSQASNAGGDGKPSDGKDPSDGESGSQVANQPVNGGESESGSASGASPPSDGASAANSSQANAAGNGGPGSGGVGDGGGQAATGGNGPVSFRDVMVEGKRVNDHTIEELIRIEDDEADKAADKRTFIRAKTAAAAHANASMSRTRIPSNAQTAVRDYFEALAKPE